MSDELPSARRYFDAVKGAIDEVIRIESEAIGVAAQLCAKSIDADGQIYLFGTGHSHMLAEEGHYRAGGLACVCPILASGLMLHEGAAASTLLERRSGIAEAILSRYAIGQNDTMILFSNSGINAVPVEAATAVRARGASLIAITSRAYSEARREPGQATVADHAHVVIDNHLPPGDALLSSPDGAATGPGSTVIGAMILNAILCEAQAQSQKARDAVYVSANMPGAGETNQALVKRFRSRNPHL